MEYVDSIFQRDVLNRCRNMYYFQNILVWGCVYLEKKVKARFDVLSAVTALRRRFITAMISDYVIDALAYFQLH